jgi:CelD/BcsL family acetyltransferase involved in cellulose biosynthesis
MRVTIVRPEELGAAELSAWRAMQRASPHLASPFLAPGFALAAGRVRPRSRVAVLEAAIWSVSFRSNAAASGSADRLARTRLMSRA